MFNRDNQLASVNVNKANEVAIEFGKILKRFNQVRQSIDLATCGEEFISAYSGLCEQMFDLANQVAISPQWVATKQYERLTNLGEQMRMTTEHVNCLYRQIEKTGKSLVFNFRRAA